ncbi:MAG TPA: beta-galactosidase trimerization domain-containing protein [Ruminiclostridium sp.]
MYLVQGAGRRIGKTSAESVEILFKDPGKYAKTQVFNEILKLNAEKGEVIAKYNSDYYVDEAAITKVSVGKGQVVYCGTFLTNENTRLILDNLDRNDPLQSWVDVPKEIEVVKRKSDTGNIYLFLNYMNKPIQVNFREMATDLLSGNKLEGEINFKPYEVILVRK